MEKELKIFLLIDGNNLLHRCYHASQHLLWESELKAVFIFLRVLISLLRGNDYQKLLVVFDSTKVNFRHQIYPDYKKNRLVTPPKLLQQIKILQDLLAQSDVPLIQLANFEADDLIASFLAQNEQLHSDYNFVIFSQDKDLMQLLSPQVKIYKYVQGEILAFTEQDFWQEYNFSPHNYIDYLCLIGDQVDNVQGVGGIGPKTAQQLIQNFGTIEKLYQNSQQLPPKIQELLTKDQELVFQNKQLITLKDDLVLPISWEQCDFNWNQWKSNQNLIEFCQKSEFKSVLKLLSGE
ncbi:5'-3' exonuclease [endosymbiont GvMRE of Glomus versiforme]|uniref:5'-3' exonuclease n=1 Tax=endosymbiont GvMRE of Glomus versiforme TaxID=2039283 RepID=UPI000ED6F71C|nr:5'-3' exonuclease H3TH domain-containing protein [endosymbiont GvMRE of Glomus versiforme]RHZ37611.1 DNA polymerase I [endosymbiont GvMRE of Glomus versiforme]